MKKSKVRLRIILAAVIAILASFVIFNQVNESNAPTPEEISVNQAITMLEGGEVESAVISDATAINGRGTITLKDAEGIEHVASYPLSVSDRIGDLLIEEEVEVETKVPERNVLMDLFVGMLPILLIVALVIFILHRQGGIGGKKFDAGLEGGKIPDVKFEDIAGADEAVHEMKEMIEFTAGGERFIEMGAKPPRGALLVGPPGTGKTLLAKAAAGESGLPFYSLSGSDFVEVFAGLGPRRVRKLFKKARETGGIIFIDEIDAIGQKRGSTGRGGDSQERENVIAAMLTEMDGFETRDNVLVLAATNRAETIDEALLRPGRLERQIHVPLPDIKGREGILKVHVKGKNISDEVDLNSVAKQTVGMSGAELAFVVNESCMSAVRHGHEKVMPSDIYEAVNTVAMGRSRDSAFMNETDRELTAYHEAGHATVALIVSRGAMVSVRPNFITIVPRGHAGGLTRMNHEETNYLRKSTARNMLAVTMGGRAAEIRKYGQDNYTSGAHGDLNAATNMATNMSLKFGMSDEGRLIAMDDNAIAMSQGKHDDLIQKEISDALVRAKDILNTPDGELLLEAITKELLENESLHEDDINRIEFETLGRNYFSDAPHEKVAVIA